MAGPLIPIAIAIGSYIAKKGVKAAIKKFGKKAVDEAKSVKKDSLESTLGRKRTGPTPKPSDSAAFRAAEKVAKRKADEKLNPSLKNPDLPRGSIESRMSDVRSQLRELMKSEKPDFKAIDRLQNRLENLKDMKTDRPDLTTMGGKFNKGGLIATHTDYRKKGLFKR
tara:strand:+ start:71 stop:571 length:501 start_codon:yes stop_codon:yes gene_type:complete